MLQAFNSLLVKHHDDALISERVKFEFIKINVRHERADHFSLSPQADDVHLITSGLLLSAESVTAWQVTRPSECDNRNQSPCQDRGSIPSLLANFYILVCQLCAFLLLKRSSELRNGKLKE